MDRPRWEILVLAAAILIGALAIASSMRANRYYFKDGTSQTILDARTGAVYRWWATGDTDNEWKMIVQPVK